MELLFLGTSAGMPTAARNVSAAALFLPQRGEWWLFDCGEGTQHQALRARLSLPKLRRVFITHLHGDHCLGLPGLIASRGFQGGTELDLYGPAKLAPLLDSVFGFTGSRPDGLLTVHDADAGGTIVEDEEYLVQAVEVVHTPGARSLAYIVREKPRAGALRAEELQALGIPFGPLYGQLKQGATIEWRGREVRGADYIDPPRPGMKLVFVADTRDASAVIEAGRDADLLVHEATYLEAEAEKAAEHGHSTAAAAGRLARLMGARRLVLTHFSPRYSPPNGPPPTVNELVAEAEKNFKPGAVCAAKDLRRANVSATEPVTSSRRRAR